MRLGVLLGVSLLLSVGLLPVPARAEPAEATEATQATREQLVVAYSALQSAYEQSPAWQLLSPIAGLAQRLDRPGEALLAYESALTLGGEKLDPEERARLERELGALKTRTAWLTLSAQAPPGRVTVVDAYEREPGAPAVTNRYELAPGKSKLGLSPGFHRLSFAGDNGQNALLEVVLQPGTVVERTITLLPAPKASPTLAASPPTAKGAQTSPGAVPRREGSYVPFYISAAVSTALLGVTIYSGATALEKHSQYNDANDGSDPVRAGQLRDEGTRLNLVTDTLIGATALGSVLSVILYQRAAHPEIRQRRPVQKHRPRTIFGVQIGTLRAGTPNQVTLSGEF